MINIIKEYTNINERVHIETLPNGLTVYVVPKRGYHKTFAIYAADYGSSVGRYKLGDSWIDTPKGVAHFLEHLMFNTAEGNALTKLTTNGASANAYTSTDITAYYFECIDKFSENLETLLDFVSVSYFTDEDVKTEQGIIEQEILMSEDDPDYCLYYGLMKSLFKHNSFRNPVAGTVESISKITADTLQNCHNVFYHPSNMVLCIAGDVEPAEITDIAQKLLPKTKGKAPQPDNEEPEALTPEQRHFTKSMDISLPIFATGAKSHPPPHGSSNLRFGLISMMAIDILAGHSSPLYFKLYNEGLANADFSASFDFSPNAAYSIFSGETREPERVFNEIKNEITKLSENGLEQSYFDRLKKAALGAYTRSLNSFESICTNIIDGHFRKYDAFTALEVLSAITVDDVISFYREHLAPENMAISVIMPNS